MPRDFYPRRDADILNFSSNFKKRIILAPGDYGLSVAQADSYRATQESFALLYTRAIDPDTRTRGAVAAKEDARVALEAETRLLARIVRAAPAVTDEMRINLGLSRSTEGKGAPLPPPDAAPVLVVVGHVGRAVQVRLRDSTSSRRGKPANVAGAALFVYAGAAPPADIARWQFKYNTTRPTASVPCDDIPPGTKVWLSARWYNPRAEPGPVSTPVGTYLQDGLGVPGVALLRAA